ncbi:TetR/AcrR family transcriptional regulator [Rhodopirellula sp. JC639]|uniref:TetR/AcrR family transcriptional regulator n=1 Tax=Stieleria mannarensis TaxID=2755585 RepID=UPI0015FF2D2B|nr:TetR/AcrR family transcriptional regulator [Rhodopirellula sp. JC639]
MKHTDRKRADILAAAVTEFRTYGYDNTTMDQIADAAGASKRTVYNHFGSKEGMFEAIVREMMDRSDVLTGGEYDAEQPLPRQLKRIANEIVDTLKDESYRDLARVVLSRLLMVPEYSALISEQTQHINTMLSRWMRAAHRDGRLRVPRPELAADQFVGMLMAYAFWPALFNVEKGSTTIKQSIFVNQTVTMFLKGYEC